MTDAENADFGTATQQTADPLDEYHTAPLKFPLHVVDADGEGLCGNLAADQEDFIEHHGVDVLPTVNQKRSGEDWMYFIGDLCGTCRSALLSQVDDEAMHKGWEERQEAINA